MFERSNLREDIEPFDSVGELESTDSRPSLNRLTRRVTYRLGRQHLLNDEREGNQEGNGGMSRFYPKRRLDPRWTSGIRHIDFRC